eukprot:gene17307-7803_t
MTYAINKDDDASAIMRMETRAIARHESLKLHDSMEKLRKTNATPQPGVDGGSAGGDGGGSNRNDAASKLPSVTTSQQEAVSVF